MQKCIKKKADIVAEAGKSKCSVTIATNMAGRGTDIKLSDEVKKSRWISNYWNRKT